MHSEGLYLLVDDSSQNVECWKYDKAKARRRKRRSEILKCILLCQCFKQVEVF
ncbi:hypothetical protein NC653_040300 [Populus alba x Populus x berolinensis]|uniref:Uncharacterized protein n=1 Tax=Populus alba x Populus x berolinensis TaxID=444605 RepID=A0AAD6PT55_9ROSI|nr:hypothetical protein NC653_040300 [Populus alba x Populus x berolinensis]